jgi:hypothetical protein
MLRESGNGDLKVVAVVFADMTDEVDPVDEATFGRFPFILTRRRVSS